MKELRRQLKSIKAAEAEYEEITVRLINDPILPEEERYKLRKEYYAQLLFYREKIREIYELMANVKKA